MTKIAKKSEAAFINQMVRDLKKSPTLSNEASERINHDIGYATMQGFITDDLLKDSWKKFSGKSPDSATFKRLRGEVFLKLLSSAEYNVDETKLRGDAASALRAISSSAGTVQSNSAWLDKMMGGKAIEVDVDPTNHRIYLRAEGVGRSNYQPEKGLAVISNYGDGWVISFEGPKGEEKEIPLSGKQKAPKLWKDMSVLTPEERKSVKENNRRVTTDQAEALKAVRDLMLQSLKLPGPTDALVKMQKDADGRSAENVAFIKELFDGMETMDGKKTAIPASKPMTFGPLNDAELTDEVKDLVHRFRDGELDFFTGGYETDYDLRVKAKNETKKQVENLVQFVAAGKSAKWGLEVFNSKDNYEKASILQEGFEKSPGHDSAEHLKRTKQKTQPAFIKKYVDNYGKVEKLEKVTIDGKVAGYYLQTYSDISGSLGAAFDAKGKLLDERMNVKGGRKPNPVSRRD